MKVIFLFIFAISSSLYAYNLYLPKDHPMRPVLNKIFRKKGVLRNEKSLTRAGFEILLKKQAAHTENAALYLARHPKIPGYLFKLFLDDEQESFQRLIARCVGAERIREIIKKEKLCYFGVPKKWLYKLRKPGIQKVILIAQEMDITSRERCIQAWLNANKRQIRELYTILSHGLPSTHIYGNIPYVSSGKFICIDTESAAQPRDLNKVKKYLAPEMQVYWDRLMLTRPQFVK